MLPRKLSILDKQKLITHLQSLTSYDDRRLRFGGFVTDEYIVSYVEKTCGKEDNKWFGVEEDGKIVAACHVAIVGDLAELGCSVDKEYRGNGLAQLMFDRAVTWLRTKGVTDVCMHCLSENLIMKHIARKNDMTIVSELGETDANVHLDPPSPFTPLVDAYADRMAIYDMVYKSNLRMLKLYAARPSD